MLKGGKFYASPPFFLCRQAPMYNKPGKIYSWLKEYQWLKINRWFITRYKP